MDKEKVMDDLISRQAAIDAIEEMQIPIMRSEFSDEQLIFTGMSEALAAIKELPSAQPEPDTRLYSDGFDDGYKQAIKDAQPEIIRCKDCKYSDENWRRVSVRWLPCMDMRTGSNWFCGSAERRTDGKAY